MKGLITLLTILTVGMVQAQVAQREIGFVAHTPPETLWVASTCGGGNGNPRLVNFNDESYIMVDGYREIVEAEFDITDTTNSIVCLQANGNVNRNWISFWKNYVGAIIRDRTQYNFWVIQWQHPNGNWIEVQRREGNNGRYNVYRTASGSASHSHLSATTNALEAWNYALTH